MNGSENYERNVWTDDDEDPQYVAEERGWMLTRMELCRCKVMTGGALDVSGDCPIHGRCDEAQGVTK